MHTTNTDGLDELIAAADGPLTELPTAAEVVARAKKAEGQARAAVGSNRPVDSGRAVHPQLRVSPKKH